MSRRLCRRSAFDPRRQCWELVSPQGQAEVSAPDASPLVPAHFKVLEPMRDHLRDSPYERYQSGFSIGGVSVRLGGGCESDVVLSTSLSPFRSAPKTFDVSLDVRWVEALRSDSGETIFDSGGAWRLSECSHSLSFYFTAPFVSERPYKGLMVDRCFRTATVEMSQKLFSSWTDQPDPLAYPLDELLIMHRLTQERAIELHGVGIVGPDGASNLFVGHSGAGKSTTARLWTSLHKVEILSDDRIIVRESPARELRPGDDPRQIFMYGTPWHGEGCFALPQRAPLGRIFVLEHGHGNVLTRLSRSQMVAELFARSFVPFHRHEYVDSALSFLEQVADSVPCYRYSFEPDARAVERILQLND